MGFTRKCRQKYGPIFKLSIFRKEIVVNHSVVCIHENTIPGWFSDEFGVKTFDRARCSIQIRDITNKYPEKFMSIEEFKNMTKSY
jgi:hypothetical protein